MKNGKKKPPEPDFKEVRPPLETNGMDFSEVMKRLSQTKPEEVKEAEDSSSSDTSRPKK